MSDLRYLFIDDIVKEREKNLVKKRDDNVKMLQKIRKDLSLELEKMTQSSVKSSSRELRRSMRVLRRWQKPELPLQDECC